MNGQEKGVSELNIAGQWTERCNNRAKLERTVIGWISILRLPMAESGCWVEVWGCFVRVCARTETMQGVCVVVCRWRGGEKRGRLDFEDFHLKWAFGKVSVEERAGRTVPNGRRPQSPLKHGTPSRVPPSLPSAASQLLPRPQQLTSLAVQSNLPNTSSPASCCLVSLRHAL